MSKDLGSLILFCSIKTWICREEKRGVGILFYLFTFFCSIEMLYFKFSTLCVNEKIKNHINKHSDNFINSCKQANMTFSFLFFLFFFFFPISRSAPRTSSGKEGKNFNLVTKFWRYCFREKFLQAVPKAKRVLGKPQSWSAKNKIIGFNCF